MTRSTFCGRGQLVDRAGELGAAGAQLAEQPRILDRDHRLVGEGRDERICFSVKGSTRARVRLKTPIGVPSRKSGTPSMEWYCRSVALRQAYSDRSRRRDMDDPSSSAVRSTRLPRPVHRVACRSEELVRRRPRPAIFNASPS